MVEGLFIIIMSNMYISRISSFVLGVLVTAIISGFVFIATASSSTLTLTLSARPADSVETLVLRYDGAGSLSLTGWQLSDDVRVRHTFGDVVLENG